MSKINSIIVKLSVVLFSLAISPIYPQFVIDIDWVNIPSGKFLYGSEADTLSIEYNYSITKTEITNGQYLKFLNDTWKDGKIKIKGNRVIGHYSGDQYKPKGEYTFIYFEENSGYEDIIRFNERMFLLRNSEMWKNHPVRFVTWFGANAFAEYYDLSLPTKYEWEKAARGLDSTAYPWGEYLFPKYVNYHNSGDPFDNGTTPAEFYKGGFKGQFETGDNSSCYGVYDMIGNVSEWTISFSDHYPKLRVFRGGSWRNREDDLRSYQVKEGGPELATSYLGFRCVKK